MIRFCIFLLLVPILTDFRTGLEYSEEIESIGHSQVNGIVICDSSKICFYDKHVTDTLFGKGVIRITIDTNRCDKLRIKDDQLIFLIIEKSRLRTENNKILEYRYLITNNLSNTEQKMFDDYEQKISSVINKRGLCYSGSKNQLDSDKFDFPFTFTVIPD